MSSLSRSALVLFLLLGSAEGCRKKAPPPPAPTATPSPPLPKGRIAFTVRERLCVADADGSNLDVGGGAGTDLAEITYKTRAWFPSASPSGKLLLFWSPELDKPGVFSLNMVGLDGKLMDRILVPEVDPLEGPVHGLFIGNTSSFSPDEKGLVYAAGNRIWRTDLKGVSPLTLLALPEGSLAACPQLSKEGDSLYYVSNQEKPGGIEFSIWKYDLATHQGSRLLGVEGHAAGTLRLSPAGDKLGFTLSREGKANVGIFPLPAGPQVMLTEDGRSYGAAFSPDGNRLLFVKDVPGKPSELHTVPLDGHSPSTSIPGLYGYAPAWSAAPSRSDVEATLEYELRRTGKALPPAGAPAQAAATAPAASPAPAK